METLESGFRTLSTLEASLSKVIRGRTDTIRLLLAALVADGHVLLEDYPGSGKTLITKTLGKLIASDGQQVGGECIVPFRRIQFTPDMLPGDILGVNMFDPKTGTFHFLHGPVFAHIILADELNRTGPKVQAAFLECMAEKQVTIDNVTHVLDELFFVVGTQNPLDLAGTYPLPIVQLDRFMIRIPMAYVNAQTEEEILREHHMIEQAAVETRPVCSRSEVLHLRSLARMVEVSAAIQRCIVSITQASRTSDSFVFGASTRAALMFQQMLRGWAFVNSRSYVTEDDVKTIAPFVLKHRLRFQSSHRDDYEVLNEFLEPHLEALIKGV